MDRQHIYADGLERVTLMDGLVRLDFYCDGESSADGKMTHDPVERLLLTPSAFLRAYEAMGQLVARMEEAGLVQRREGGALVGKAGPSLPPASTRPGRESSSPNFS